MYVGIDVGKHRCRVAMMDKEGHLVNEFSFSNDSDGILDLSSTLSIDNRVIMESTGSYWMNIYDKLEDAHAYSSGVGASIEDKGHRFCKDKER
jgi:transposase